MKINLNQIITAPKNNILVDVFYPEKANKKLVLFCHGFKGFKDWGAWHLVAKAFTEAGYVFIKFNFSHNGIGQDNLLDFTRLDLFQENTYSKEAEDVVRVLDWIEKEAFWQEKEVEEISIIGHSRGGAIALLSALEDDRVSKVITWASIANFDRFGTAENVETWQKEGFKNFYNSRTKQDMKIDFAFYEDFIANEERLNLKRICKNLKKPLLIIHGKEDPSVGFSHAQRLKNWKPDAELHLIEGANHVFGMQHPFEGEVLPEETAACLSLGLAFLE